MPGPQEAVNKYYINSYYNYLLTTGSPLSAKELGRKHLLTILEIITVSFTASEESNN